MSDRVRVTTVDGVADVRLSRPDKRNAVDVAMFGALVEAGESLQADRSVRVVVLSGDGRDFCAGLDLGSLAQLSSEREPAETLAELMPDDGQVAHLGQRFVIVWHTLPVPVLAAVHGNALGAGFQLALGADIRFVHPDARLSVRELYWGLVPDMTGTYFLPRLVGPEIAKLLTFTARIISGSEAGRLGLASHVTETPLDDAFALAHELAGVSPHALRAAKRLLDGSPGSSLADVLAGERAAATELIGSPNQREAVSAGFEKRPPRFVDP